MKICFVYQGLFPGTTRAARHVEAMARRFVAKGHSVSVVTTAFPEERDPDDIAVVRLPHAPEGPTDKDDHLLQKTIARHLRQDGTDVLFAESLSPLSALAVKAAGECHVPTIVRVLSDSDGIVHDFGSGRRATPRVVRKKITALLEHATAVAASSDACAELVRECYAGPIHVIEKCVDLNVFRLGRTTRRDMEAFLARQDVKDRRILLYARERLRQSTPAEVLPLLPLVRERAPDVVLMLVGELEGEGFDEEVVRLEVGDVVRCTGLLETRDFFAAYEAASIFLVPPASRASVRELLEAMAMGCAVVCFEETAAGAPGVVVPDQTALVLAKDDLAASAARLADLLADAERLRAFQESAVEVARRFDLMVAIQKVEDLCSRVLGLEVAPEAKEETGSMAARRTESDPGEPDEENASERQDDSESRAPASAGAGSTPAKKPPQASASPGEDDLVWNEEDVEGEALRFDPDSEMGFDRVEVDEEAGSEASEVNEEPPPERGPRERDRERERDRDRDRRRRRRGRAASEVDELGASSGIDVLEMPTERRRRPGALEPGLTLKDLLPFLRPPKTVLILGASTGEGHNRTASALSEAFRGVDRNLIIREADALELMDKSYRPAYVRSLLEDLSRNPAVFGAVFETVDPAREEALPADLDEVAEKAFGERFDHLAVEKRPDHLVCTHWLPLRHLEALKKEEKLPATVTAVNPEPELNPRWISPVVEHYVVAAEGVKAHLVKHGVDPSAVTVSGVPVSPSFAIPAERDRVLRELGLRSQVPTLLFRPGGIGATERILAATQMLLEATSPLQLLVVAGKNERLKEDLARLEPPKGGAIKAFGFVDNIRDLMGVADLLITRASPHTVAEASAIGLPMIVLRPSPGMEERIADRLLARGVAVKAYGEADLEEYVRELLKNRRLLVEMQEAGARWRRPDAAAQAVDRIARIVK